MREFDFGIDIALARQQTLALNDRQMLVARMESYLIWPEDEDRRRAFLAGCVVKRNPKEIASLAETSNTLSDRFLLQPVQNGPLAQIIPTHISAELGQRITALLREVGVDISDLKGAVSDHDRESDKNFLAAMIAGQRLHDAVAMAVHHNSILRGGASLGKATDLTVHRTKPKGISRDQVKEAWKSHRHVAHLAAGIRQAQMELILTHNMSPDDDLSALISDPVRALVRAKQIFDIGIDFIPKQATKPFLDSEEAWRIGDVGTVDPDETVVFRLSEEDLNYLTVERWAPTKY